MKIQIALAAAFLAICSSAHAQVTVSVTTGTAAHDCYVAAKTGIKPNDGIAVCNVALHVEDITPETRAATLDNRGVLYDLVKNYSSAWDDFNASIHYNPNLGDPYLNRGVALIRLQRANEALSDIQKGMGLGLSLPQLGYYDLAVAEEILGQITPAYHDYKRALDADPGFAPATIALTRFTVVTKPAPAS